MSALFESRDAIKPFHWSLPAYRHVGFAAGVHGFGHGVDQVAADAEVAHLHLALRVDQHVGGLHVCGGRDGPQFVFGDKEGTNCGVASDWLSPLCMTCRLLCRCSNALTICNDKVHV